MLKKKILVVDDDSEMRLAMHVRLKARDYDVCFATDGVSCIAETRKNLPDLILLDLGLPAGDGFTVLDRLHAIDTMSCIPVIVISGRNRAANHERALNAGAKVFLQKPVRNDELMLAIENTLGTKTPAAKSPTESNAIIYEIFGNDLSTALDLGPAVSASGTAA
jgi:DNA-binding response OmpR family regulator